MVAPTANAAGAPQETLPPAGPSCARSPLPAYFVLGLDAIVVQALLIRAFLVACQGNELCLGLIFGAWFAWVVVGTRVGTWAAGRIDRPRAAFCLALTLAVLLAAAQLTLVQLARSVLGVPTGLQMPLRTVGWFALAAMFPFPFVMLLR